MKRAKTRGLPGAFAQAILEVMGKGRVTRNTFSRGQEK